MEKPSKDFNLIDNSFFLEGIDNMPGGFFVYCSDFSDERILYANKSLLDLFECETVDEFFDYTNSSFKGIVHPDDYLMVEDILFKQIQNKTYDQIHYRIVTKKGNVKYVEAFEKYFISEKYGPIFYVFISVEKEKIDSLTGLPKMRYFINLAKEEINKIFENGKIPVMVSFDLIGLKNFNFKYGLDEGDILLSHLSEMIKNIFGKLNASRFGEDNFYAIALKDNVEEKVKTVIENLKNIPDGKSIPIRIGIAECDRDNNIEFLCNKARIAIESLKNIKYSTYKWFNEEESYALSLKEYIINHIDEAISKGWIEPYYQPVVRTLTKRLCSLEVLARWIDPVHGLIASSNFVSILEEIGLTYKLDMYIAERAISTLQHRIREGLPVVPISINVSRMDFEYINPVEVIAATCDMHEVRRSLVCIEITESAFISNKDLIKKAIDDFHQAGFEVWMDDFGSGYSSLNVLKDFDFDELKLDMAFIHDFGEKSRNIITMAIRMAKSLGMHTLAEGVETEEHFQFLKSIGCEKIQGYYFGEPKPLPEQLDNLRLKGIVYENRETSELYQKTGKVDLVSDRALALFFFDGKRYTTIFRNKEYIDLFPNLKRNNEDFNAFMNSDLNPLSSKFRSFGNKVLSSKKIENMTFVAQSCYYHFSLEPITITSKGAMMIARLDATTFDEQKEFEERDGIIRSLSIIYDCVYLFDFDEDTMSIIQSNIKGEIEGNVLRNAKNYYKKISNKVYEFDLIRWEKFWDQNYLIEKARSSGKGFFSDVFLIKNEDGNYIWSEYIVISASKENKQLIICVKPAALEDLDKKEYVKRILSFTNFSLNDEVKSEGDIWKSLTENGNLKLFWKDKDRRFLGASKAFRKYYDFKDDSQFIGKTDEDLGFHLNDSEFESDEYKVLKKGEIINYATTVNVVDGVAHRIIASKVPVYHDAKIIGLVGYFVDSEEDGLAKDHYDRRLLDPITGLMNTYGLMISLFDLGDNFVANNEEYTFVVIKINGYQEFMEDHGNDLSNELLIEISKLLKASLGERDVIARTEGMNFSVCSRGANSEEMYRCLKVFEEKITSLTLFKNERIRLTISFGIASSSEGGTVQKVAQKAYSRLDMLNSKDNISEYFVNLDAYNDIPLPFVIVRPIYDSIDKLKDMEFIFVNKAYSELTGKSPKDLIGKGYLDTFKNTGKEWIEYTFRATQGEYVRASLYDGATHHWLRFTAAPCEIAGACSLVLDVFDQERRIEQSSFIAKATSAEIIKIIKILETQERNSKANALVVEEIGKTLDATSAFIFTTDLVTFTCIAEWHKEGIESRKEILADKPYSILKSWNEKFIDNSNVIYLTKDIVDKNDYANYNYFMEFNIESLYASPIMINNKIVGYLVVENVNPETELDTKELIEQATFFIAARFNLRKLYQAQLEYERKNAVAYKESLTDDLAIEIGKILGNNENYQVAIDMALDKLGDIFHPTRTFILEINDKKLENIIEWCNSGVLSLKDLWIEELHKNLNNIFMEEFLNDDVIIVDNIDVYKKINPDKYRFLKENNVNKFIEAPIYIYDKLVGFIIMTNYKDSLIVDIGKMLELFAFFVGFRIMSNSELIKSKLTSSLNALDNKQIDLGINSINTPIPTAILKVVLNDTKEYAVDFKYENVNEQYCKMVDRTMDELINNNYYEIFHSPDPQLVSDSYRAAILGLTIKEKRFSIESGKFVESIITPCSKAGYAMLVLLDIDSEYREDLERKNKVNLNESVMDVVKVLNSPVIFEDAINRALRKMTDYIRAEHVYILEYEGDYFRESFYYSLDGIEDNMSNRIKIEKNLLYKSKSYKSNDNDYFYDEIASIEKTNPDVAQVLKEKNVVNMLHTPLYNGEVIIGYLGIQNFDKNYIEQYSKILIELSYFFSAKIIFHKNQMQTINQIESNDEDNLKTLNSISQAYYGLAILDLTSNMMKPIGIPEEIKDKIGNKIQLYESAKVILLERYVSLEDKNKVEEFLNLATLDERLKYKKSLYLDYKALNGDKRRIIITVLEKNNQNKLSKIIVAVQD